jgi:hypothetical protein
MRFLCVFLCFDVSAALRLNIPNIEVNSAFESNASVASQSKPWEQIRYLIGAHHKAGTVLLREVMRSSFKVLGVEDIRTFTPHIFWSVHLSKSEQDEAHSNATAKGLSLRGVQIIRDPMSMIVSGYCYHHAGNEQHSPCAPQNIMSLTPTEGIPLMASYTLKVVAEMAGVQFDDDVLTVRFEDWTRSSADFDEQVNQIHDFLFRGVITAAERNDMIEQAKLQDIHRRSTDVDNSHVSSDECVKNGVAALHLIPDDSKSEIKDYRKILGYDSSTSLTISGRMFPYAAGS